MHQSMQVDANRLLKCPNLSINCLDASGIVLGTFLLGNKLGVTLCLCSRSSWGWWRWAGTSSKAGRGQCRVWRQGGNVLEEVGRVYLQCRWCVCSFPELERGCVGLQSSGHGSAASCCS